ncbi:MAG: enoyl-CoA hydratase-related protein [Pseudomonadota bacterium]
MRYETLLTEMHGEHVLLVSLNRPHVRNAFNTAMAQELIDLFEGMALDGGDTRCIVVTGAPTPDGKPVFCAGGDLKERRGMDDATWGRQHLIFERMTRALLGCPVPMIGAVEGAAYAGGCEIACAMDFLYAGEAARFAQTETRIGIIPGAGGTQTLARAVGERRAKEIILSARPFDAEQALDWGLANAVLPSADLLDAALATAALIAANAPIAVRQAKQAIHRGAQMSLRDGLAFEIEAYNRTVPTADRREGVNAFNEAREPRFKGE